MAKYSAIKAAVNAYIKQNGRKEITGKILNAVLNATIDSLGKFYQFAGEALPTDDPGTPDQNLTYLAGTAGTYTNFGGLTLDTQEIALLMWDGEWKKQTLLFGIQEVDASVDNQVGTPSVDVDFVNNVLTLSFHNIKGDKGDTGDPAGFGQVTASVDDTIGNPSVQVQTSGEDTAKNIAFEFHGLRGETGITSVVVSVDNTTGNPACSVSLVGQVLHLDFTGLKGLKGDTGVSADYPITIYNGLDSDATDQALSAAQGKVLDGKVSQLGQKVDGLGVMPVEFLSGYYYNNSGSKVSNANSIYTEAIDISDVLKMSIRGVVANSGRTTLFYRNGNLIKTYNEEALVNLGGATIDTSLYDSVKFSFSLPTTNTITIYATYQDCLEYELDKGLERLSNASIYDSVLAKIATGGQNIDLVKDYTAGNTYIIKIKKGQSSNYNVSLYKDGSSVANNVATHITDTDYQFEYTPNADFNQIRIYESAAVTDDVTILIQNHNDSFVPYTEYTQLSPEVPESRFEAKYEAAVAETISRQTKDSMSDPYIIRIATQQEFDGVQTLINDAVAGGHENIVVLLTAERLVFDNEHFNFTSANYPNASGCKIAVIGDGVTIIAAGEDYALSDATNFDGTKYIFSTEDDFDYKAAMLNGTDEVVPYQGPMLADSEVVVLQSHTNSSGATIADYFKLKLNGEDTRTTATKIRFTCGFQALTFDVDKIEDGWVYCYGNSVDYFTKFVKSDNVNRDYAFSRQLGHWERYTRYILLNSEDDDVYYANGTIRINDNIGNLHICDAMTFAVFGNAFAQYEVSGIKFVGNKDYGVQHYDGERECSSLLWIKDNSLSSKVFIHDNDFRYIKSAVIGIGQDTEVPFEEGETRTPSELANGYNVSVYNNSACDCYRPFVNACHRTKNVYVYGNKANNMGRSYGYEGVIAVVGDTFLVINNDIQDFHYAAIKSGSETHIFTDPMFLGSKGIIERNEVGWSDDYKSKYMMNGLSESGAIYIYSNCRDVVVRFNVVYNYNGYFDGHGIFVDGYASNVKVVGNGVFDCGERSVTMYIDAGATIGVQGINNLMMFNVLSSLYHFSASGDNSFKGMNFLLMGFPYIFTKDTYYVSKYVDGTIVYDRNAVEDDYVLFHTDVVGKNISLPYRYINRISYQITMSDYVRSHFQFDNY